MMKYVREAGSSGWLVSGVMIVTVVLFCSFIWRISDSDTFTIKINTDYKSVHSLEDVRRLSGTEVPMDNDGEVIAVGDTAKTQ